MDPINTTIAKTGISAVSEDFTLYEVLNLTYGGQQTFLTLSLLYNDASWGTMPFHQDHIFASSMFKKKDLSPLERLDWIGMKDRIGNLCLLLAQENLGKQDMPIDKWLASREPSFLKRHLIPEDKSLWKFERFPDFLIAREELIKVRLKSLFA